MTTRELIQRIDELKEECDCYEGMAEGAAIRIADLESALAAKDATIARLESLYRDARQKQFTPASCVLSGWPLFDAETKDAIKKARTP
jgi:uncharacterized coiled-coil DUF342 family protein